MTNNRRTLSAGKDREPLFRIVKKPEISVARATMYSVMAFLLAIVAGGFFILAMGHNPFDVYGTIVTGCFRSQLAFRATVKIAIPLLISSLGVTLAFKMRFWNIGAEGQIIMGAMFASYFALFYSHWPHGLLMLAMFLAGMLGGGLWGLIPAFFKVRYNTNETLLTLMLNYIALYLIMYFREGPWRDPASSGFPKIATFVQNARLDTVFGIHAGWVIGLILVVVTYVYLKYTKQGYEISVVGESERTARYAGMNVSKIVLRTMFISGAVCGVAGMSQAAGAAWTLNDGIAGGVGFTAIIVVWLAQLNPYTILVVTALFSILEKGSGVIQTEYNISVYASSVLQGIILFFVLAFDFFTRYSVVMRKRGGKT